MSYVREGGLAVWHLVSDRKTLCGERIQPTDARQLAPQDGHMVCAACKVLRETRPLTKRMARKMSREQQCALSR